MALTEFILAKWFSSKHNVIVPAPYTFGQDYIHGVVFIVIQKQNLLWPNGGNSLPARWQNIMQKLDNLFI